MKIYISGPMTVPLRSDYMRLALRDIADAEAIHMLPGWEHSRGARIELALADHLGMPVQGAIR